MFAPVAVDNIQFPTRTSLSTLDFIPESFDAFQAYSNIPTSSTYTTQSIITSANGTYRWGINDTGKILGVQEGGGPIFIWDTVNETSSSIASISLGTAIRNVVWDNLTNSWVICGTTAFMKVNCDTLATSSIAVPTNVGTQYPAVVAFGGKAYGLPLVTTGANTAIAIFDLVANTATTSSVKPGTGGWWSAIVNSVGTIYFCKENGTTTTLYEYNPTTTSGSAFANFSGTPGYGLTNLPNGNVFIPNYGVNQTVYIVNPVSKAIQTIATAGFGYYSGICVGQNGHPYGIGSSTVSADNNIWGFNTTTNLGYKTQYRVQGPSTGGRGFQDLFSLADGRLVAMPGISNNGLLVYYTFLQNPRNNTFSQVGVGNPIMQNAKGI